MKDGSLPIAGEKCGLAPYESAGSAVRNQPSIVRDLLDKGADPNLQDKTGVSALIVAARKRDPRMVQMLLAKGEVEALAPMIEKLGLSAAVYTQTTDVEGEVNGLNR